MTAVYMGSWESAVFLLGQGASAEYAAPDGKSVASLLADRAVREAGWKQVREEAFLTLRRELDKAGRVGQ